LKDNERVLSREGVKMDKFVDFLNKHTVDEVVATIVSNNRDKKKAIQSLRDSRTAYQIKTQEIQWKLEALLDEQPKFYVGQTVVAREDCMNNFKKGDKLKIMNIDKQKINLGNIAVTDEETVRKYFSIVKQE
jgi:hypothetical protein